jgi:hypothetical protein
MSVLRLEKVKWDYNRSKEISLQGSRYPSRRRWSANATYTGGATRKMILRETSKSRGERSSPAHSAWECRIRPRRSEGPPRFPSLSPHHNAACGRPYRSFRSIGVCICHQRSRTLIGSSSGNSPQKERFAMRQSLLWERQQRQQKNAANDAKP